MEGLIIWGNSDWGIT